MNNPTLEKRKRNELVTPSRNESVTDLKIICQDGVTFAHQFILGRHSRYLKQLFASSFSIDNVRLVEPKCNGVERRIKIDRSMVNNELHLLDFSVKTVDLLLSLMYTGSAESQGDLDPVTGELLLVQLYRALQLDTGETGVLPDIAELEYVMREGTRPRAGDKDPARPGGEVTIEPEVVDISQDEEDTGHEDGNDLSGRPSPCVVEHIEIEEYEEEETPAARYENNASNDGSRPGRTDDHEVDELLKDDDSTRGESQSFNFESGAHSPDTDAYSAPCLSPLDLSKSAEIEMVDSEEPKEDEAQSSKAVSDTSFLDAVNQDFTEVSNDSNYGEIFNLKAQIDNIVEQQSTSVQIKLNKVSKTKSLNDSQSKTGEVIENTRDTETEEGNVLPKESQDQYQKKRNKRKSSPRSPKRKKQKSAHDIESNPDQPEPPHVSHKEAEVEFSTVDKFYCPVAHCNFYQSSRSSSSHPQLYYVLKHFISEHLANPPLKLYDFNRAHTRNWPCSHCPYTNESKTSIFAHMAIEHQNLFERISKNASIISKDPRSMEIIECIDNYLTRNWDKWTSCEQLFADLSKNENVQVLNQEINHGCLPDACYFVEAPLPVSEELVFTENTIIPVDLEDETQNENHIVLKHPTAVEEMEIFCNACFNFKFKDVKGLRCHLLKEHSGDYEEVPFLEAGEKYFECNRCSNFKRNKSMLVFMKHHKKIHGQIYRGLLDSDEAWNEGVLCEDDFCSPRQETVKIKSSAPADLSVLHDYNPLSSGTSSPLSSPHPQPIEPRSPPTAPPPPVLRENPLFSPEEEEEKHEQSPKSCSDNDNVSVIEDFAYINIKKMRGTLDLGSSCKVCDMEFTHPRDVSRHVFLTHLENHNEITKEVWRCLYTKTGDTYFCSICNCGKEAEQFAKLHIYNKHKRDLKKMMDRKKIDWKNLLDFIGYNVPERLLQEDESDFEMEDLGNSSPGISIAAIEFNNDSVSKAKSIDSREEGEVREEDSEKNSPSVYRCPFNGCQELFSKSKSGKKQLLIHYFNTHKESTLLFHLVESLMPGKVPRDKDATEYKLNLNKDGMPLCFYLCSCLATFRTQQALEDHKKLCDDAAAERLRQRCEHCLGFFEFCPEHIAKECAHVDELRKILDLTA